MNCPYCGDTKHRLWINHRWGINTPGGEQSLWWAIVCYNEKCFEGEKGYMRRRELERRIYGQMRPAERSTHPVRMGEIQDALRVATDPGECVTLTSLAADHPAIRYLRDERQFDIAQIEADYGASYCVRALPEYNLAQNRIIIPIHMRGQYVGWQARYVGNPPSKAIPKYWTMPGLSKRLVLYDYDAAKHMPFVVICEGPTDAWRVGTSGVAILGKSLHPRQAELVAATWKAAVLLLDPEAVEDSRVAYARLQTAKLPLARIELPEGTDPGSTPRDVLWRYILDGSRSQGLDLERMIANSSVGDSAKSPDLGGG